MTTLTNTDDSWKLAVGELAYYCLTALPIAYIIYTQGRPALRPWIYLSIYVGLQIAGNGIIAAAGRPQTECTGNNQTSSCPVTGGQYTYIAVILTSVGLSPLIIGTAAILHQWFETTLFARSSGPAMAKRALITSLVFHLSAAVAIALIASGGSLSTQASTALIRAGAALLLIMWLVLCAGTTYLAFKYNRDSSRALLWSVIVSLPFLGIRYVYELASTISTSVDLSPILGTFRYRLALSVLPQALVLLILIIGAIVHTDDDIRKDATIDRTATIPLRENDAEGKAPGQRWMRGPKYMRGCGMFNL